MGVEVIGNLKGSSFVAGTKVPQDVHVVDVNGTAVSFGGSGGTSSTDEAAYTPTTSTGTPVMGAVDETLPDAAAEGTLAIVRATLNRALHVNLRDASGNEVAVAGGTQYTEGDTDATITGTAMLMEGAANALVVAQGTAVDGLLVNLGTNNDVTVTGAALTALQLIDDLVLTEDAAHSSGAVGVMPLAVRQDTLAALAGTTGDYSPLSVDAEGALYVTERNVVSSGNSSTVVLAGGAAFTGTGVECGQYASITVAMDASHDSATNGISMQFSTDNSNWDVAIARSYVASDDGASMVVPVLARYFRLVYTNGPTLQTHFRIQSILHANPVNPSDGKLSNNVSPEKIALLTKSALVAQTNGSGEFIPIAASASGRLKVDVELAAGTNNIGDVNVLPDTTGGLSLFRTLDLDETEEEVKATAGQIYGLWFSNTATSTRWLKFYNATAANVTVGTTTPVLTIALPGNASDDISGVFSSTMGIAFDTAITVAATTGVADADTGAPGANECIVNVFYK